MRPAEVLVIRPNSAASNTAMASGLIIAFCAFWRPILCLEAIVAVVVGLAQRTPIVCLDRRRGTAERRLWRWWQTTRCELSQVSYVSLKVDHGESTTYCCSLQGDGTTFEVQKAESYWLVRECAEQVARFLQLDIHDLALGPTIVRQRASHAESVGIVSGRPLTMIPISSVSQGVSSHAQRSYGNPLPRRGLILLLAICVGFPVLGLGAAQLPFMTLPERIVVLLLALMIPLGLCGAAFLGQRWLMIDRSLRVVEIRNSFGWFTRREALDQFREVVLVFERGGGRARLHNWILWLDRADAPRIVQVYSHELEARPAAADLAAFLGLPLRVFAGPSPPV